MQLENGGCSSDGVSEFRQIFVIKFNEMTRLLELLVIGVIGSVARSHPSLGLDLQL